MKELAFLWPNERTVCRLVALLRCRQKSEPRDFPSVRNLLATAPTVPNPEVLVFDLTSWDTIHEAI